MIDMLPTARDIAIIVLALEGIIVLVVPFLLLWRSAGALRRTRPRAAVWLRQANVSVAQTTQRINSILLAARRPFLWFATAFATLTSALKRAARVVGSGR